MSAIAELTANERSAILEIIHYWMNWEIYEEMITKLTSDQPLDDHDTKRVLIALRTGLAWTFSPPEKRSLYSDLITRLS